VTESALSAGDWLRRQGVEAHEAAQGAEGGSLARPLSLEAVFAEEPVPLDTFIRDRRFIGMSPLSDPQYEVLRYAERIFYPELYPQMAETFGSYWSAEIPVVNFLTLMVGKGGGKDMIARLASLRIAYLLLCLHDPRTYFGMPGDESIHILNVASTRPQARLAYFEPMTRIVRRGWFADKCQPMKTVIEWDKGLTSISGSSDAETQEGLNLILGVADEVDAFRTTEDIRRAGVSQRTPMRSAEGIIKMLRTSAITRFPQTFKNLRISYPRYVGSPISELHAAASRDIAENESASRHFVVGPMPSWEFNPLLARSEVIEIAEAPVPVPVELAPDFREDPSWSRAAYLCLPERTLLPAYFRSEASVEAAMVAAPCIEVFWDFARGAWHPHIVIPRELVPMPGATYVCHADLALNQDRAGFAMAHVVSWDEFESMDFDGGQSRWERLPVINVDVAIALEADLSADPPREIQLRTIRKLIFELRRRGFRIAQCSLDGWQSLSTRQDLEVAGVEAPLLSIDRTEDPYKLLRTAVEEGRALLPWTGQWGPLLRSELLGLIRDPRTGKVDHAPEIDGSSKDVSDAVAGAVWGASEIGGAETDEVVDELAEDDAVGRFGVVAGPAAPIGADSVLRSMVSMSLRR
jgi:hypothetical protein